MRIEHPKRFGAYLMAKRKESGLHPRLVAEKVGIDQRTLYLIETGQIGGQVGAEIDDDILDGLTDAIPGFSVATSPGVTGPPMSQAQLAEGGITPPGNIVPYR